MGGTGGGVQIETARIEARSMPGASNCGQQLLNSSVFAATRL